MKKAVFVINQLRLKQQSQNILDTKDDFYNLSEMSTLFFLDSITIVVLYTVMFLREQFLQRENLKLKNRYNLPFSSISYVMFCAI